MANVLVCRLVTGSQVESMIGTGGVLSNQGLNATSQSSLPTKDRDDSSRTNAFDNGIGLETDLDALAAPGRHARVWTRVQRDAMCAGVGSMGVGAGVLEHFNH